VKRDVQQVVAQQGVPLNAVLNPKLNLEQGIILMSCTHIEPDAPQPLKGPKGLFRQMRFIVPQHASAERRKVGDDRQAEEERETPRVLRL
jgi:hypothetical protein